MSAKITVERVTMLVVEEGDPRSGEAVEKLRQTGKDLVQLSSDFGASLDYKSVLCSGFPLHLLSLFFVLEGMGVLNKNYINTIPELEVADGTPDLGVMINQRLEGFYYLKELLPAVMYIKRGFVSEYFSWLKMKFKKNDPKKLETVINWLNDPRNLKTARWIVVALQEVTLLQEGRPVQVVQATGLKVFGDTTVTTIDLRFRPPKIETAEIPVLLTRKKK